MGQPKPRSSGAPSRAKLTFRCPHRCCGSIRTVICLWMPKPERRSQSFSGHTAPADSHASSGRNDMFIEPDLPWFAAFLNKHPTCDPHVGCFVQERPHVAFARTFYKHAVPSGTLSKIRIKTTPSRSTRRPTFRRTRRSPLLNA